MSSPEELKEAVGRWRQSTNALRVHSRHFSKQMLPPDTCLNVLKQQMAYRDGVNDAWNQAKQSSVALAKKIKDAGESPRTLHKLIAAMEDGRWSDELWYEIQAMLADLDEQSHEGDKGGGARTDEQDRTEAALECLTSAQRKLVRFLMDKSHWAMADTLKTDSGAFRKGADTTDRAVESQVETIKTTWTDNGIAWDIESRDNREHPKYRLIRD